MNSQKYKNAMISEFERIIIDNCSSNSGNDKIINISGIFMLLF